MDINRRLANFPLFEDLTPEAAKALSASLEEKQLSTGQVLFAQGDAGNCLYFVVSGKLHVYQPNDRNALVEDLAAGDCAGALAVLTSQKQTTPALAGVVCWT